MRIGSTRSAPSLRRGLQYSRFGNLRYKFGGVLAGVAHVWQKNMRANELSGCGSDFVAPKPSCQTPISIDYRQLADRAWIALVQRGDEEAARALIERLSPLV